MDRLFATLLVFAGCAGPPPPLGVDNDDTSVAGDDDDDTTEPRADEGSLIVMQFLPHLDVLESETVVSGMFASTRDGWVNLAQCVSRQDMFCADAWPAQPGDSVPVAFFEASILETLETREVGEILTFGPWTADYVLDSSNGLGFYFRSYDFATAAQGELDLEFGPGAWGNVSESVVLSAPTPMAVTSHDPMVSHLFPSQDPISLRWEPGQSGEVYVLVRATSGAWLYRLDDTGSFDLEIESLGLTDGETLDLVVGRWAVADVDVSGRQLNTQVQINQWLRGEYRDIAARVELTSLYDTCAEASVALPVEPGNYTGDFSDFAHHHTPGPGGCTGFDASGVDAVFPVVVEPNDLLEVTFRLEDDDASLYVRGECLEAESCVAGSDQTSTSGVETVSWLNDTDVQRTMWVHLDAFGDVTGGFTLDVSNTAQLTDVLKDTCVEAIEQGPVSNDVYMGTLGGYSDFLDPECVGGAGGGEGVAQFNLLPGQELTAVVTAPGRDPKLYLMYNCAVTASCFLGINTQSDTNESLVYTNSSGVSEFVYLALDADFNIGDYTLDVEIQ